MNKSRIDRMIPKAYELLNNSIAQNGKIEKNYRGGVSSFGAAVAMGSLLSAAAFFSADSEKAGYNRKKLGCVIARTAADDNKIRNDEEKTLYCFITEHKDENGIKELIMDAAVAVKLAMSLFELV